MRRDTEPPRYVRPAHRTGLSWFDDLDWLDLGFDYRMRYEHRDNDYRRRVSTVDETLLLRTRLYVGIRDVLGPLRAAIEVEDARRTDGSFPRDDRDVNLIEPIQAFGELSFDNGAGQGRPLRIKVGRQAFEYLDRRLLARNEWRNTTNTFDGVRASIGRVDGPWQADVLVLRPVVRRLQRLDTTSDTQWLVGAIGDWRRWSRVATIQPYYLRLTQDGARVPDRVTRDVHTMGLRSYGVVGSTGWDWDVDVVEQVGRDGGRRHRARALMVDAGYTTGHVWAPRFSASYLHAGGDRNPLDTGVERFERLFGFARPLSASDYIQVENVRAPKLRVEFAPSAQWRIDAGVSGYWLASATDRWSVTGLRDPTGRSGTSIGQEIDVRVRFPVGPRVAVNVGYARFWPGDFTRSTSGRATPSQLPYAELSLNAFR